MTGFSFQPRLGFSPAAAVAFNPLTAGIGAGVGLAVAGAQMWLQHNDMKNRSKSATTAIVNQLEEQLRNLRDVYLASVQPSCSDQRAALNLYDQAWQWLQGPAACGEPGFGSAGDACIADRAPGGRWPWRSYYRDPIANDPRLDGLSCDVSTEILLPGGAIPAAATSVYASSQPPPPQPPASTVDYLPIIGAALAAVVIAKVL